MSNDIYCDSNLFLAWLLNEPGRVNDVQNLFNSANNGSVRIITSALTISEVLHLKGLGQVPKNDRQKVRSLFQNPWVLVIGVNRTIAEESQDLVWGHNIMPKDAIHIATALIH